jgi:hypothetical protein
MDLLAKYDESEDLSDSFDKTGNCIKEDKDRKRLTLFEKKQVVERYYAYLDTINAELPAHLTMRSLLRLTTRSKTLKKLKFQTSENGFVQRKKGNFYLGVIATNLNKKVCYVHKIIERIDYLLKKRDPYHAIYNKIVKSPTVPDEYGIVARSSHQQEHFSGIIRENSLTQLKRNLEEILIKFSALAKVNSLMPSHFCLVMLVTTIVLRKERIKMNSTRHTLHFGHAKQPTWARKDKKRTVHHRSDTLKEPSTSTNRDRGRDEMV